MSFIKTSLLIITVLFLTACKTVPTTPDENSTQESEQTKQQSSSTTSPNTPAQNSNNNKTTQNANEKSSDTTSSTNLTSEEQAQQLDQQLDDRFADFDRLLLREREFLSDKQKEQGEPQNEGSSSASGGGLDGFDSLDGFDDGDAESASQQQGNSGTGQAAGESAYPGNNTHVNTPPDLVNTKGDDVIARQLREAAQKEKDPVLREKLWNEYRKYKSGI